MLPGTLRHAKRPHIHSLPYNSSRTIQNVPQEKKWFEPRSKAAQAWQSEMVTCQLMEAFFQIVENPSCASMVARWFI